MPDAVPPPPEDHDADRHVALVLCDDPAARAALADALAPLDLEPLFVRPPFDASLIDDADCAIVAALALPAAGPTLARWRALPDGQRPPLFLAIAGDEPVATGVEIDGFDGVLMPAQAPGLARRMIAAALEHRAERLDSEEASRFAGLGKAVAGVLHELKNPLNNLLLGLDFLERHAPPTPDMDRWKEMVRRNGELLRESLQDLLEGFRVDAERRPAALHAALDKAAQYVVGGDLNFRRRIAIEKNFADPPPIVLGNAGQLLHLFLNLMLNARQALGENTGLIGLATKWDGPGWVVVEVRDNGPGIASAALATLFQQRRSTKRRGTGLGLALSKEIVDRHGGAIGAANNPGGGACFRVRLPATPAA